jgi:hypothetical protein
MRPIERVLAALGQEEPDRVPRTAGFTPARTATRSSVTRR